MRKISLAFVLLTAIVYPAFASDEDIVRELRAMNDQNQFNRSQDRFRRNLGTSNLYEISRQRAIDSNPMLQASKGLERMADNIKKARNEQRERYVSDMDVRLKELELARAETVAEADSSQRVSRMQSDWNEAHT